MKRYFQWAWRRRISQLFSIWNSLNRLITSVSHLSQKPVMSSLIYMFVPLFVNYVIRAFTLNTESWDPSHWKMVTKEGGGVVAFLSHCNREWSAGETQDSIVGKYRYYQSKRTPLIYLFIYLLLIKKYDDFFWWYLHHDKNKRILRRKIRSIYKSSTTERCSIEGAKRV